MKSHETISCQGQIISPKSFTTPKQTAWRCWLSTTPYKKTQITVDGSEIPRPTTLTCINPVHTYWDIFPLKWPRSKAASSEFGSFGSCKPHSLALWLGEVGFSCRHRMLLEMEGVSFSGYFFRILGLFIFCSSCLSFSFKIVYIHFFLVSILAIHLCI